MVASGEQFEAIDCERSENDDRRDRGGDGRDRWE